MANNGDFSKISNFYSKNGHVVFEPLLCPNFIPSFKKILRAYTHAHTDGTDFISPFRFPTGDQQAYIGKSGELLTTCLDFCNQIMARTESIYKKILKKSTTCIFNQYYNLYI